MKISQAIRELSTIRAFHGDLDIEVIGCCDSNDDPVIYLDKQYYGDKALIR